MINKYKTFIKYGVVAISSFILDILLFNIFLIIFKPLKYKIIIATIAARVISSLVNFFLNKNRVFDNKNRTKDVIYKYYILVVVQMLVSAFTVNTLDKLLNINVNFIKIPVETIIFINNYFIQKYLIFKNK